MLSKIFKKKEPTTFKQKMKYVALTPVRTARFIASPIITSVESSRRKAAALWDALNPIGKVDRVKAKSRNESFDDARKRVHATEKSMMQSYSSFVFIARMTLGFTIAIIISALGFLIFGKIFTALPMISISLISFALCHRYTFRAYQIKKRQLGNYDEFMKNRENMLNILRGN